MEETLTYKILEFKNPTEQGNTYPAFVESFWLEGDLVLASTDIPELRDLNFSLEELKQGFPELDLSDVKETVVEVRKVPF